MLTYETARPYRDETNVSHAFLAAKAPGKPPEVPMQHFVADIENLDDEYDLNDLMGAELVLYRGEARQSGFSIRPLVEKEVRQH